jgi:hypothetical protein
MKTNFRQAWEKAMNSPITWGDAVLIIVIYTISKLLIIRLM